MRWPQWPFPKKKLLRLECLAPLLITSLSTIEHLPSAPSSANYLTNSSELASREWLDWYRLCFVWQRFAPSSCYQIAPEPSTRVAGCATLFSCPAGTAAVVVDSSSLACQLCGLQLVQSCSSDVSGRISSFPCQHSPSRTDSSQVYCTLLFIQSSREAEC